MITAPTKISTARFNCLNDNANLPIIHDLETNQAVTYISSEFNNEVWLGLTCTDSACTWDDNSLFNYQNFFGGNQNVSYGNCAYLSFNGTKRGFWESADCNFGLKAVLCQTNRKFFKAIQSHRNKSNTICIGASV